MSKDDIKTRLKELGIIGDKPHRAYTTWPEDEVIKAFRAFSEVDTITIDPHKLGYVIYPAGGIAMRDKRMRESIHTYAPYVFKKPAKNSPDIIIGSYILEGSKPGAAAAAVWTAHKIMPLNITGYGKLIGETIDGAQALFFSLNNADKIVLEKNITIEMLPVTKPDINIVNYAFNFSDNKSLTKMNELTKHISENIFGFKTDDSQIMLEKSFIVSSTEFTYEEYGDSPMQFLKKIGIQKNEWDKVHEVKIVRSVIMSPYLTTDYVDENYVKMFIEKLKYKILQNKTRIMEIFNEN